MTQSRWADDFIRHPFQATWSDLKYELDLATIDDLTVITSVSELARLKRVVSYLDRLIHSIDPDLTPHSVWNNFDPQAQACREMIAAYNTSREINDIRVANDHADNLLTYIRPFMVFPPDAVSALNKSAQDYASLLESHVASFRNTADSILIEIKEHRKSASSRLAGLIKSIEKIESLEKRLFNDVDGRPPTERQIENLLTDSTAKNEQISKYHADIFENTAEKPSIKSRLSNAEDNILSKNDFITNALKDTKTRLAELKKFHDTIYGTKNDSGEITGGLSLELESKKKELENFESYQQKRHETLFNKIDSLLPGATSAGLASAYRSLKESFNKPIASYTRYFYFSLIFIAIGTFVFSIEEVYSYPPSIKFVEVKEWDDILRGMLGKSGFYIPLIWLALFSATRRSQYERLQQEYSHKEAFASSYDSYKKQLQDLQDDSQDLQRELISKTIDAISYNASTTLDGRIHDEKTPLAQIIEKAHPETIQKLIEILKFVKIPPGK